MNFLLLPTRQSIEASMCSLLQIRQKRTTMTWPLMRLCLLFVLLNDIVISEECYLLIVLSTNYPIPLATVLGLRAVRCTKTRDMIH